MMPVNEYIAWNVFLRVRSLMYTLLRLAVSIQCPEPVLQEFA